MFITELFQNVSYLHITHNILQSICHVPIQCVLFFAIKSTIELVWVLFLEQKIVSRNTELDGSILKFIFLPYVTNFLFQALSETGSYLYAGSTCINHKYKDFKKIEASLKKEFPSLCYGFAENNLSIRNLLFSLKQYTFFLPRKGLS